jgi:hypothetical protein
MRRTNSARSGIARPTSMNSMTYRVWGAHPRAFATRGRIRLTTNAAHYCSVLRSLCVAGIPQPFGDETVTRLCGCRIDVSSPARRARSVGGAGPMVRDNGCPPVRGCRPPRGNLLECDLGSEADAERQAVWKLRSRCDRRVKLALPNVWVSVGGMRFARSPIFMTFGCRATPRLTGTRQPPQTPAPHRQGRRVFSNSEHCSVKAF